MFSIALILTTLCAAVNVVRADPDPNEPGPGDVFNEGSNCPIGWGVDTTGVWKTMNIELMTGDNFNMIHLTTVGTVDGTDATKNTYSWTCPQVTPNSAIYFYQFTSPDSPDTLWTTRFAIADASGNTTPPTNQTQPGTNAPIPWGIGTFVNPSLETPPPTNTGSVANSTASNTLTPASSVPLPSSSSSNVAVGVSSPVVLPTSSMVTKVTTASTATNSVAPAAASGSTSGSVSLRSGLTSGAALLCVAFAVVLVL